METLIATGRHGGPDGNTENDISLEQEEGIDRWIVFMMMVPVTMMAEEAEGSSGQTMLTLSLPSALSCLPPRTCRIGGGLVSQRRMLLVGRRFRGATCPPGSFYSAPSCTGGWQVG